ncbi:hypothetical protein [Micromonospora schwarzwaldensis]|uniref:hypothetical protein n=1 Tax=Micromonospora sp. DSM 45708 TaxID=3111767 RepID=UPI0031D99E7A
MTRAVRTGMDFISALDRGSLGGLARLCAPDATWWVDTGPDRRGGDPDLAPVITTLHLHHAASAAELLGIPDDALQITMLPVAHTVGTDFRVAARRPVNSVSYLDRWGVPLPYRDKPVDRLTGEDHV